MTYWKRFLAAVLLVITVATGGTVLAGEAGRKNTRNALGAATVIMAVKGNTGGAAVGAVATVVAQNRLHQSIRQRHRRQDDPNEQRRLAAQSSLEDFTRNVQRKKDKEMAELQFVGGDGSSASKQVVAGKKVGRNEKCPCGSGKKYKHCHGG